MSIMTRGYSAPPARRAYLAWISCWGNEGRMQDIMKARKKDTAVKPPATLDAHPDDFDLPPILYLACKVFARLKSKPNPDKFPGTLLLRKFAAGEVLCRQGDSGWT